MRSPDAMERLCLALHEGLAAGKVDPLLVSMEFAFDFTCVRPFTEGNGRMNRPLTLLPLYRSGYLVGKYVSVEKEIERPKGSYYEVLAESSRGRAEGANDPGPFVRSMPGVLLECHCVLERRASAVRSARLTKAERVDAAPRESVGKVTKADLMAARPGVSRTTVERTLASLLAAGEIEKVDRLRLAGAWRPPRVVGRVLRMPSGSLARRAASLDRPGPAASNPYIEIVLAICRRAPLDPLQRGPSAPDRAARQLA